jgi:organic radical activating enzyme
MPKCNALEKRITIALPGSWRVCCQIEDIPTHYLTDYTHKDFLNSEYIKKFKDDMVDGWFSGCEVCRIHEELGMNSLRQNINRITTNNQIEQLEISLSNYCNLSCKICSPDASSKWETYVENNPELNQFFYKQKNNVVDFKKVFDAVDLSNLKLLKYLGGEPFITPETFDFFTFLEDENIINNVTLITNTNATFFPKKHIKYLSNFKRVNVGLSIDGYGLSNDYSRNGSDFDKIKKNVNKWVDLSKKYNSIQLRIHCTLSAYTFESHSQLKKYASEMGIEFCSFLLQNPKFLTLNALPEEYVRQTKNSDTELYLKNYKFDLELFKKLKEFTKKTDKVQGKDIKDYIPNLAKFLQD